MDGWISLGWMDGWMDGWITENILSLPRAKLLRREKGLERCQKKY
jgi:hypothetical protein